MAKSRKLSRKKANREALLKNVFKSLILHKKVVTTEARAKEVKRYGEKILAKARKNDLHTKRDINKKLDSKIAIKELFEVIVPSLPKKDSGFIKFQKVVHRAGDGSDQAALIINKTEGKKPLSDKKQLKGKR